MSWKKFLEQKKIVTIIQARLTSKRLPKKILKPILGKKMIDRVIERCLVSEFSDFVVVASPHEIPYKKGSNRVFSFLGSESNVLERYKHCADYFKADVVVRITSDCPLVQPELIDYCILTLWFGNYDFVSTRPQYADGLDVEVFSKELLDKTYKNYNFDEHVTSHMIGNQDIRKCFVKPSRMLREKYSVDTNKDLKKVVNIYKNFRQDNPLEWEEL